MGPAMKGNIKNAVLVIYVFLTLLSLLSCVLSLTALNIWDRVPAAELPRYFTDIQQEFLDSRVDFQAEVIRIGFSLFSFSSILTGFRIIGCLSMFILSAMIVIRYSDRLVAVLFAGMLSIFGAGGIWANPMFGWAAGIVPWMEFSTWLLNGLSWLGVIVIFIYPDGRFTPRWTVWAAVVLLLITLARGADLQFFLNPNTWPAPVYLFDNLVFFGLAIFSVLYRYNRSKGTELARKLRGYVLGVTLLFIAYFVTYFIQNIYWELTGNTPWNSTREIMIYVLVNEPIWFTLQLVFALLTGRSIFKEKLLEGSGSQERV